MSSKILVTPRTFGKSDPVPLIALRQAGYEVIHNPYGRMMSEDEMIEVIHGVDGLIVGLDPVTKRVLENAPRLKAISKYGVGVNNIDLEYATSRGILVTNTPGANSVAVAELTLGLLMAVCRRICASDRDVRQGRWSQYTGMQLDGKTLGVVGTGQIGRQVAERARGLRMSVICHDIYPDTEWADSIGAVYMPFGDLIASSDYISLHIPLTEQTFRLLSHAEFRTMKPSTVIVNTSRGGIVDEEALYDALTEGRIAGAALDVFEEEPPQGSPLFGLDNVVLTSHIGAHTRESVENMGRLAASNLIQCLNGLMPEYVVNRELNKGVCCAG